MKYKFVKKGTEISSESVKGLMDFGQVMDKAAGMGMGAAPLAKGALGVKAISLTKVIAVLAIPFSVVVYFAVDELTGNLSEEPMTESTELKQPDMIELVAADTTDTVVLEETPTTAQQNVKKAASAAKRVNVQPAAVKKAAEDENKESFDYLLSKEDIMIKAEPVGGFPAFYELIDRELTYPESSRISNTEGFVRVYFVVDKDGKPGKFKVVRSLGDAFDEEALRVMSKIPAWVPATHN